MANVFGLQIFSTPSPVNFNTAIAFGGGMKEDGSDGICDVKKGNCWFQH